MVRGGRHNTLSQPNEHHIWLFECFGLMQGQAAQWRGETEAMCLTGSARPLLTLSLSPFSPQDVCLVKSGICTERSKPQQMNDVKQRSGHVEFVLLFL